MKTFKLSLVLHTRKNTDVFITLDENIFGSHSKRVNILYMMQKTNFVLWTIMNIAIISFINCSVAQIIWKDGL